jgi:nicotinate phosphoribosyltransferase
MKLSPGKRTLPGAKQVWRRLEGGRAVGDLVSLRDEPVPRDAVPLLEPVMRGGVRLSVGGLSEARERAAAERSALAPRHRRLDADRYPVETSPALRALGARLAAELSANPGAAGEGARV